MEKLSFEDGYHAIKALIDADAKPVEIRKLFESRTTAIRTAFLLKEMIYSDGLQGSLLITHDVPAHIVCWANDCVERYGSCYFIIRGEQTDSPVEHLWEIELLLDKPIFKDPEEYQEVLLALEITKKEAKEEFDRILAKDFYHLQVTIEDLVEHQPKLVTVLRITKK